jgi:hypothetical protein
MPFSGQVRRIGRSDWERVETDDAGAFREAVHWYVDTIEGRLAGAVLPHGAAASQRKRSSIYWRPQDPSVLWRHATQPLHPDAPRLMTADSDGRLTIVELDGQPAPSLRLVDNRDGKPGLFLAGQEGAGLKVWRGTSFPAPAVSSVVSTDGFSLRVVGPDYIVTNAHLTCVLRRQGGVVRELIAGGRRLAVAHDLYGDQAYFAHPRSRRMEAQNDVECGIRVWRADDGLHLSFEGQLRGFNRFALKRPPLWYRNEYVFSDGPRFTQRWAFRTEKAFSDQTAFLAWFLRLPDADAFRFLHQGKAVAENVVGDASRRLGERGDGPVPDCLELRANGRPQLVFRELAAPPEPGVDCFVHGRNLFITLLDGKGSAMQAGQWYEFHAVWDVHHTQ